MNSLVKVPPYSKLNFQRKIFFTQNWCNITLKLFWKKCKIASSLDTDKYTYFIYRCIFFFISKCGLWNKGENRKVTNTYVHWLYKHIILLNINSAQIGRRIAIRGYLKPPHSYILSAWKPHHSYIPSTKAIYPFTYYSVIGNTFVAFNCVL